ncbi:MAG: queuosine precursor transporter [Legionellales bacterium]|nr:queuosine precursor transporter [Legionellales bacterium]
MNKISKYPFILLAIYIGCILITVSLANRLVIFMGVTEAGGIFVFPLMFPILDIMGEVYGYSYPRLFIWLGVAIEFFFSITTILVSAMPSPSGFVYAESYHHVFDPTLRYVFSGLVGTICGEFINVYLLAKWKIRTKGRFFIARSFISTAIGQGFLSFIVINLMFLGKMSYQELLSIAFNGWLFKMVFAFIYVIPAWYVVAYLKNIDKVDYYDFITNFNPFKMAISS